MSNLPAGTELIASRLYDYWQRGTECASGGEWKIALPDLLAEAQEIAAQFGLSRGNVSKIINRRSYADVC